MEYLIKSLDVDHNRSNLKKLQFDCGDRDLNDYIKRYAWRNDQKLRSAKIFVICSKQKPKDIKGYYTSSASEILTTALPEESRNGHAKKIPALLIGKLAVDKAVQEKGLGKQLLKHAYICASQISQQTGVFAVYTQAKDQKAKEYYIKRGFEEFQEESLLLYQTIETITEAIKQAKSRVSGLEQNGDTSVPKILQGQQTR